MTRPKLLDLFCGAGGCAVGYHKAGFDVTGVDIKPQPRFPFAFRQADALDYLAAHGSEFDAIHASPPCQRYTHASFKTGHRIKHPDLLGTTRSSLVTCGRPWVIENVLGAPLAPPALMLCGLMFGLKVFRHRWFETSHFMLAPSHPGHRGKLIGKDGMMCCVGHGGGVSKRMRAQMKRHRAGQGTDSKAEWQVAMGIDWMTRNEMSQAIPPAYTEFIGRQLMGVVRP